MLQQILNDMYIEPELLAELDEEQKQILFCKMREEQVRRWREREKLQEEEEEEENRKNNKKKDGGKKVTFLMGMDGEPMVVVLGGEEGTNREDVDSILEERAKRQADLEADMLKRAAEEELDKLVRLSRSTVEAMEEEATRTVQTKVRDPAREAVVRSLQEATVEMEGQIQALEEAEAQQRKLSSSSTSSSSSGASSPSSPSPSSSSVSSSSSSSSSSSGIGSIGSPRLALSSSPSTSSLSSLSSFASSQPPSPPAFTISTYGTTSRHLVSGAPVGMSMWEAVNRSSQFSDTTAASNTPSSTPASNSSHLSTTVKPPILSPKPSVTTHTNGTQPANPPHTLRTSQPFPSPPSSLSSTTSSLSSSSSSATSPSSPSSPPPVPAGEAVERVQEEVASPASSVVGVAAQIRRFEQLSEGSLEALKTATLERAKKRREREILEHLRSQVEAARQQAASTDPETASRQQQAAEKDDIAWQEQERKAKEAERRIREIARRAREEHRRASHNTPPSSPPITALNYNLNGFTRLTNGINGTTLAGTHPAGDINGNVNSVADDISNNNDSISLKKYSSSSSSSSLGSPGVEGLCVRQRLRPPKPPCRAAIIAWFRDEELSRGAGLDPMCSRIAPWFHGIISRTEAEDVLSETGIGCFLVRVSERIWGYAISYRAPDRCRHYLIDVTGGKYTFFGSHQASHNTLGDLIEHHKREPITVSGGELLTRPCGQLHPRNPDYRELFAGTPYMPA
ncbi:SH2 domain-containing protein 4B-like isoform X2 [Portunus trituberculatus]|uniref:SH2 domain-containing protein 4B-like isoform X2 n=1 Tax=Portunus trituberculatus TaxID=210409 RepID=UPI001E1CE19F|nr:SH2 domain-containing protein 4B-like isoform X2 [Portunus trituberculatus]XP_045122933.1 SH2 domain-containing protein 4B-like isoform X2 [Portunus trituberculatus]